MAAFSIVWPTIALVALTWAVWFRMYQKRIAHLRANPPTEDQFRTGAAALRYFQPVEMPANNLANLFEMPVLYFALVPLLLTTGHATVAQTILACLYVVFRALHSWEHVGINRVMTRFRWYLMSCAVLMAMWIGFTIDFAVAHLDALTG
ncbi:MAPEG family protein [Sphingomonas sanxanigenens]|uniref:MAPEG family protein n=1 Tax=Sphingomonas sanxanigenens DSM 19645 = NX02 TaxID=1123269 RepID=W0ACW2_9SPHN|nr:MAPEG family protein [Sphingomonas sanxanigenens]AHE55744.1 hypothetical protein NX02_20515 [Sphingomonas sanxanigenens DSM 19645 = NX02]